MTSLKMPLSEGDIS